MPENVGTANYATKYGIPPTTLTWVGRSGTQTLSGTLFTAFEAASGGELSQTRDNNNEIRAQRLTNDSISFSITVKPIAANEAAALLIAGDPPKKNALITATGGDIQLTANGSNLCEEARTVYAPDGESLINMTITKHIGKTFVALS
jgi:hypothetical protein